MTQTGPVSTDTCDTAEARAKKVRDMTPEELVAGPGALPDAPLDMPDQIIERPARMTWRIKNIFPRPPLAGNGA